MRAWKLRYQFYVVKAEDRRSAIRIGVEKIKADAPGFVIDAESLDAPRKGLIRSLLTGP